MKESITLSLSNELSEIQRVTTAVDVFCNDHAIPAAFCFHLNLVLDELLTNIISYGYPSGSSNNGYIELRMTIDNDHLTVYLLDDGLSFNPLEIAPPNLDLSVDDKPIGGLGIHFVRKLVDEISYTRQKSNNILFLKKILPIDPLPEDEKLR